MLSKTEIEEFLRQFVRRVRDLDEGNEARLQKVIWDAAQELQAKLAAQTSESSETLGAVAEGSGDQTNRLPTPPNPGEDPGNLFDPQRDISPG